MAPPVIPIKIYSNVGMSSKLAGGHGLNNKTTDRISFESMEFKCCRRMGTLCKAQHQTAALPAAIAVSPQRNFF